MLLSSAELVVLFWARENTEAVDRTRASARVRIKGRSPFIVPNRWVRLMERSRGQLCSDDFVQRRQQAIDFLDGVVVNKTEAQEAAGFLDVEVFG